MKIELWHLFANNAEMTWKWRWLFYHHTYYYAFAVHGVSAMLQYTYNIYQEKNNATFRQLRLMDSIGQHRFFPNIFEVMRESGLCYSGREYDRLSNWIILLKKSIVCVLNPSSDSNLSKSFQMKLKCTLIDCVTCLGLLHVSMLFWLNPFRNNA